MEASLAFALLATHEYSLREYDRNVDRLRRILLHILFFKDHLHNITNDIYIYYILAKSAADICHALTSTRRGLPAVVRSGLTHFQQSCKDFINLYTKAFHACRLPADPAAEHYPVVDADATVQEVQKTKKVADVEVHSPSIMSEAVLSSVIVDVEETGLVSQPKTASAYSSVLDVVGVEKFEILRKNVRCCFKY